MLAIEKINAEIKVMAAKLGLSEAEIADARLPLRQGEKAIFNNLKIFEQAEILTKDTFMLLVDIRRPAYILQQALETLKKYDLLQELKEQAFFSQFLSKFNDGFGDLMIGQILWSCEQLNLLKGENAQANFRAIINYANSYSTLNSLLYEMSTLKESELGVGGGYQAAFNTLLELGFESIGAMSNALLALRDLSLPATAVNFKIVLFSEDLPGLNALLHTFTTTRDRSDLVQSGATLLSFGCQFDRFKEKLASEAFKLAQDTRDISWNLVQFLGLAYQPSSKHPIHVKLKQTMETGALKALLAGAGVSDPVLALKLVYSLLHSHKTPLYSWIQDAFKNSGQESALTLIRTPDFEKDLVQALKKCLLEDGSAIVTTTARTAAVFGLPVERSTPDLRDDEFFPL